MACQYGCIKVAEMIINKSAEFDIKLNAKDGAGKTAFLLAVEHGQTKLVDMFIQKFTEANIKLNVKDHTGKTNFHFACMYGILAFQ